MDVQVILNEMGIKACDYGFEHSRFEGTHSEVAVDVNDVRYRLFYLNISILSVLSIAPEDR